MQFISKQDIAGFLSTKTMAIAGASLSIIKIG